MPKDTDPLLTHFTDAERTRQAALKLGANDVPRTILLTWLLHEQVYRDAANLNNPEDYFLSLGMPKAMQQDEVMRLDAAQGLFQLADWMARQRHQYCHMIEKTPRLATASPANRWDDHPTLN